MLISNAPTWQYCSNFFFRWSLSKNFSLASPCITWNPTLSFRFRNVFVFFRRLMSLTLCVDALWFTELRVISNAQTWHYCSNFFFRFSLSNLFSLVSSFAVPVLLGIQLFLLHSETWFFVNRSHWPYALMLFCYFKCTDLAPLFFRWCLSKLTSHLSFPL